MLVDDDGGDDLGRGEAASWKESEALALEGGEG